MTKDEAVVFAPIIKAYAEGKTIQFIGEDGKWHDFTCEDVVFADNPEEYRIKPEAKYRPFANAQECWEEMQKHQPFGWVQEKSSEDKMQISRIGRDFGVLISTKLFGNLSRLNNQMRLCFDSYTFADGKPFGIEEGGEQ